MKSTINIFGSNVTDLLLEKDKLQSAISIIEEKIKYASPSGIQTLDWKIRSINCISGRGKYSTTIDILSCLAPGEKESEIYDKYINSLSVALNSLAKEGYIKKVRLVGLEKGNYYALPDWIEDGGGLKIEYTPDSLKPIFNQLNAKIKGNYVAQ